MMDDLRYCDMFAEVVPDDEQRNNRDHDRYSDVVGYDLGPLPTEFLVNNGTTKSRQLPVVGTICSVQ